MVMVVEEVPSDTPSGKPLEDKVTTTVSDPSSSESSVEVMSKETEVSPSAIVALEAARLKSLSPALPSVENVTVMACPVVLVSLKVNVMVEEDPSVMEEGFTLTDN